MQRISTPVKATVAELSLDICSLVEGFSELSVVYVPLLLIKKLYYSLLNRTDSPKRRNITGIRQSSACQHGRDLCPYDPEERLRHIPDYTRWGGRWQNHQCQHRTGRRRTRTQNAQERFAGNRPLHHLWQPNRLNAIRNNQSVSWQNSKVQGSDTGHGACSDQTYFCAPDP